MVNKINDSVKKRAMKENVGKTKVMDFERDENTTECDILIDGEPKPSRSCPGRLSRFMVAVADRIAVWIEGMVYKANAMSEDDDVEVKACGDARADDGRPAVPCRGDGRSQLRESDIVDVPGLRNTSVERMSRRFCRS
ncbi:hypothetical protein EVAR_53900_1 [Eumeta japonica]|uniref:Uncharacterized protein n=1 Tax=Eumeta variegata TaxID=151549 RepID=A0A4C1YAY1_EUMVA|nr:hypothetical protein EVAR_53900_1 [Eumeta japonica]